MINNKVIYTCLVGDYDDLMQPNVIYEGFDYICFSNDIKDEYVGVWRIKEIPYFHKDKTRMSRFVKLNPHIAVGEYEYSIWIDSNVQILDYYLYERACELISNNTLLGMVNHPDKESLYEDAYICAMSAGKDFYHSIAKQVRFLRSEGFPKDYPFYENNLILRKHNHPIICEISNQWWDIYMSYSKRDQLSLCYVLWRMDYSPNLLLPHDMSTHDKTHFNRPYHKISILYRVKRRMLLYFNWFCYLIDMKKPF